VDLTESDEEMLQAPATPPPHVSGDEDMDVPEEDELLHYGIGRDHDNSDSDEDGFQHV